MNILLHFNQRNSSPFSANFHNVSFSTFKIRTILKLAVQAFLVLKTLVSVNGNRMAVTIPARLRGNALGHQSLQPEYAWPQAMRVIPVENCPQFPTFP
jgi:hypothetical protein